MHHAIGAPRVLHCPVECHEPHGDHYREHDGVGPVKWILLDEYGEDYQRDNEPHVEHRDRVPL